MSSAHPFNGCQERVMAGGAARTRRAPAVPPSRPGAGSAAGQNAFLASVEGVGGAHPSTPLARSESGALRRLDPAQRAAAWGRGTDQRVTANPASSISMMRSRAKRASTHSAPWTHCQGSETTFSASHWRAASFSGWIEMIVRDQLSGSRSCQGFPSRLDCLDGLSPADARPTEERVTSDDPDFATGPRQRSAKKAGAQLGRMSCVR